MKNVIFLLLMVFSQFIFGQSDDCTQFESLINTYVQAWNDENPRLFDRVCDPNIVDKNLFNDIQGLKDYAQLVWKNYRNTEFVIEDKVCGKSHAVVEYTTSGYSNEYASDYTGNGMLLLKVRNGKISVSQGVLDIYPSLFEKGFTLQAPNKD